MKLYNEWKLRFDTPPLPHDCIVLNYSWTTPCKHRPKSIKWILSNLLLKISLSTNSSNAWNKIRISSKRYWMTKYSMM